MNGWLDDVLAGYLGTVSEREFDAAFSGCLRSLGYDDIHFLHGALEFGKDFIAKRDSQQWAFQTKAGDINLGAWRQIRSQVEEMVWNDIAHPNFDSGAVRRPVLVTTGRLVGGAAAEAQQYARSLAERTRQPRRRIADRWRQRERSTAFEIWDRDTLLSLLSSTPETSLNGWNKTSLRDLLGLLADVDRRVLSLQVIERSSRTWDSQNVSRTSIAASVVGNRLSECGRPDLACAAAYALIRCGAVHGHSGPDTSANLAMDIGESLFEVYANAILEGVGPIADDAAELFGDWGEMPAAITYPVRCSIVIEALGMLGLLYLGRGDESEAGRVADVVRRIVRHQPGASHPISDRWAISLVPPSILLRQFYPEELEPWLASVVGWVCDRHDRQPGLASVYSSPQDEVKYLLGDPYEHVALRRRTQSYIATIILDLSSTLELHGLYDDAFNDFAAVDLAYPVIEPLDLPGQYQFDGTGVIAEANISFDEFAGETAGWQTSPHHRRAPTSYEMDRQNRSWELLAVSLLLRDRHFLSSTRRIAGFEP